MKYELTVLYPDDIEDWAMLGVEQTIKQYATITKREDDGVKRLAYPVMGREKAHYIYYELKGDWYGKDGDTKRGLVKMAEKLNTNYNVIRYLLVKADPREER